MAQQCKAAVYSTFKALAGCKRATVASGIEQAELDMTSAITAVCNVRHHNLVAYISSLCCTCTTSLLKRIQQHTFTAGQALHITCTTLQSNQLHGAMYNVSLFSHVELDWQNRIKQERNLAEHCTSCIQTRQQQKFSVQL